MSVTIPEVEVELLIELMTEALYFQKGKKVSRDAVAFSFIESRRDAFVGAQIKTILEDTYLKVRVYINKFSAHTRFNEFRIEAIQDTSVNTNSETWVCYATLPTARFPTLSRVRNEIPEFYNDVVESPFDQDVLKVDPEINDSGMYSYFTSAYYPVGVEDQIKTKAETGDSGIIFNYTSTLYHVRGQEQMAASAIVGNSVRVTWPIEKLTLAADVQTFTLTQTYFPPTIVQVYFQDPDQSDSDFRDKITLSGDVTGFTLVQTYFPPTITQIFYQRDGQSDSDFYEDITLAADVTDFALVQTFFPSPIFNITYQVNNQSSDDFHEDITLAADVTTFALVQTVVPDPWSPSELIVPPRIWLNDTSGVTDAGGGTCSQWNDISGTTKHFVQATSTNRPTIIENTLNGKRVIRFNGTNSYLYNNTNAKGVYQNVGTGWLACVYAKLNNDVTGSSRVIACANSGSSATRFAANAGSIAHANTPSLAVRRLDTDSTVSASASSALDLGFHMLFVYMNYDTGVGYIHIDGSLTTQANGLTSLGNTTNSESNDRITIGAFSSTITANGFGDFDLAELIFGAGGGISQSEIDSVFGYLAWKFALQDLLPSDHPYKTIQPVAA